MPEICVCVSIRSEAIFDKEAAESIHEQIGKVSVKKIESCYSRAVCYIWARMQICIYRLVSLCNRIQDPKLNGGALELLFSAAIPILMNILDID